VFLLAVGFLLVFVIIVVAAVYSFITWMCGSRPENLPTSSVPDDLTTSILPDPGPRWAERNREPLPENVRPYDGLMEEPPGPNA
jgi:hypothetical protein